MSDEDIEIEPAAEMVLQDMVDEYVCRGTDIYEFVRDVFRFGFQAGLNEGRVSYAEDIIYDWEKDDSGRKS